ncbi:MAG: FAD-dependent monooxygenase [Bdellovibrionales bacterium]|nr:FAD-dependent monooxygenase [Bdellovibrionales bacterium]
MSQIFHNLNIPLDQTLEEHLQWLTPHHGPYRILRQSVDARTRHSPHFVVSVEVAGAGESLPETKFEIPRLSHAPNEKPLIIGSGPAGLFAALRLVEHGIPCHIFERGSESTERMRGINRHWRYGELDPRNNVCYGEGGAGLYSDGKLITRIKSPHIPYVMNRLVQFGAPKEVEYLSNPHVGSDRIRRVIPRLREYLKAQGCEFHFNTKMTELLVEAHHGRSHVAGIRTEWNQVFKSHFVVLAIGHSAEDTLLHLRDLGVFIEGKSFAMGLRIEHPQKAINQIQYRDFAEHPRLGAANYRLAHHDSKSNIGVYSFCMCPGGYVLSSGTEADGIVVNGMSNYLRNSPYANAALVVSIPFTETFGKDVWGGLKLRRELEQRAFQSTGSARALPAQNLMDFVSGKLNPLVSRGSSPSGAVPVRLDQLLPANMRDRLVDGLKAFEKSMTGFFSPEAMLYGVESRTSCPVRITRDEKTLQSISHPGLYPTGEGTGYAGGITSSACDGIRMADQIFATLSSQNATC